MSLNTPQLLGIQEILSQTSLTPCGLVEKTIYIVIILSARFDSRIQ
jgi:hypothetical protein